MDWGNSRACTCRAIASSWAARRSASSLSAAARRLASTAWVTSSKLTREKVFPSTSRKRAKTPPHTGASWPSSPGDEAAAARAGSYLIRLSRGELVKRTPRSEEHTSELQSPCNLVCRLLLEKKKKNTTIQ